MWHSEGILVRVFGEPAAKGSPKLQTRDRNGQPLKFPRVLPDSTKLERWTRAVEASAMAAVSKRVKPVFDGKVPLGADVHFYMPRPATVKRPWPSVKPDLDKLVRAVLDPLHGLVFKDDGSVVRIHTSKSYPDADGFIGCVLEVWPLTPTQVLSWHSASILASAFEEAAKGD